jgi:hypothetical protein
MLVFVCVGLIEIETLREMRKTVYLPTISHVEYYGSQLEFTFHASIELSEESSSAVVCRLFCRVTSTSREANNKGTKVKGELMIRRIEFNCYVSRLW